MSEHWPTLVFEDGDGDLCRCDCGEQGFDFKQGREWFASHVLAAAPSTPEPDADGFMMMHNAGRHDVACKWSRPGIIDASVDPCTCGLAEDIAAILASTPEPGIDVDKFLASLTQRMELSSEWRDGIEYARLEYARLASKDQKEQT